METVTIQKRVFEGFVLDLGKLLLDFEKMLDAALETKAQDRLAELKSGAAKPLGEGDYRKLRMKLSELH